MPNHHRQNIGNHGRVDLRHDKSGPQPPLKSKSIRVRCEDCGWEGKRKVFYLADPNQVVSAKDVRQAVKDDRSRPDCPFCHYGEVFFS